MRESQDRQPGSAEPPDYMRVIRARAWVIVLAIIVVLGATLILSYSADPQYRAASQLVFQPNSLNQTVFGADLYTESNQPRDVETGAKLVKVEQVADEVRKELSLPYSTVQLLRMVDVATSSEDNLLTINVESSDPTLAAQVANSFATQFVTFRQNSDRAIVARAAELVKQQLDALTGAEATSEKAKTLNDKYISLQILEAAQTGGFSLVQQATPPVAPFSPQPIRDGLLALGVGIILGLAVAFMLEHFDRRIKDVRTLERAASVPVLATVPTVGRRSGWIPGRKDTRRAVGFDRDPILLESFRILRSSLKYFDLDESDKPIKSILVASGEAGQGKTVSAINLALSLTIAGNRVVLIDADLRHPKVAQHLGLRSNAGLSTVLSGGTAFIDVLQPVNVPMFVPAEIRGRVGAPEGGLPRAALFCLTAGPLPPNPSEVLGSARMETLIRELEADEMVDFVIVDSAPILAVADALVIAPKVDAVLIAARINRITRDDVQQVNDKFSRSGARVIGMVVAGVKAKPSPYYKHAGASAAVV